MPLPRWKKLPTSFGVALLLCTSAHGQETQTTSKQEAPEAICTLVNKLIFEESFSLRSISNGFRDSKSILRTLYREPLFDELLTYTEPGQNVEKAAMVECLVDGLERYITELPLCPPAGERIYPGESVLGARGASAAALLLADCDPDGRYLPVVARAYARSQEASRVAYESRALGGSSGVEYIHSTDGAIFAVAVRQLLAKVADNHTRYGTTFDFPTNALISDFQDLETILDAQTAATPKHQREFLRDQLSQSELYRISTQALSPTD